ncbi:MAG: hypothetical protein HON90_13065 [Halobacteriovoraceae bacterium]|jgi:hypothetical protein|nr:hypothetical protein [Halobacteriovoraceae bacterium]
MNKPIKLDYSIIESDSEELLYSALKEKLKLSFELRIESHENARKLVEDLSQAGQEQRARSKQAS